MNIMKNKFKLEFIKYYPTVQDEYWLSPVETLIFWYVTEVIEFQRGVWNKPVCFTASQTIADNLNCKSQTVNNAIRKLKDKWLFETRNRFVRKTRRKYRHIYLPWEAPINKDDKVQLFFDTYLVVKDNKKTRAIIGDWIYNHQMDIHKIVELINEYYDEDNYPLDEEYLRWVYASFFMEAIPEDTLTPNQKSNEEISRMYR